MCKERWYTGIKEYLTLEFSKKKKKKQMETFIQGTPKIEGVSQAGNIPGREEQQGRSILLSLRGRQPWGEQRIGDVGRINGEAGRSRWFRASRPQWL